MFQRGGRQSLSLSLSNREKFSFFLDAAKCSKRCMSLKKIFHVEIQLYTFRISNRFAVRWQWQTFPSTTNDSIEKSMAWSNVWAIDRDTWKRIGEKEKKDKEYHSDSNGGRFLCRDVPNLFDDTGNSSWSLQNRRLKTTIDPFSAESLITWEIKKRLWKIEI